MAVNKGVGYACMRRRVSIDFRDYAFLLDLRLFVSVMLLFLTGGSIFVESRPESIVAHHADASPAVGTTTGQCCRKRPCIGSSSHGLPRTGCQIEPTFWSTGQVREL